MKNAVIHVLPLSYTKISLNPICNKLKTSLDTEPTKRTYIVMCYLLQPAIHITIINTEYIYIKGANKTHNPIG